jgi:hypothetical protein
VRFHDKIFGEREREGERLDTPFFDLNRSPTPKLGALGSSGNVGSYVPGPGMPLSVSFQSVM